MSLNPIPETDLLNGATERDAPKYIEFAFRQVAMKQGEHSPLQHLCVGNDRVRLRTRAANALIISGHPAMGSFPTTQLLLRPSRSWVGRHCPWV
jgi:hypothetical protein